MVTRNHDERAGRPAFSNDPGQGQPVHRSWHAQVGDDRDDLGCRTRHARHPAETTGRVSLGIELNPAYVDVAVERWQRFTGSAAMLEGSMEPFDDLFHWKAPVPGKPPN